MVSTCALATPPKKYGGTELVVAELAKGLIELGHEVTVYATGDSGVFGDLRYHFESPCWPPNELAEMRHAGFAWRDIVNDAESFDVVHVHHAAALPTHWVTQRPTVLTVHHSHVDSLVQHYRSYPEVAFVAISNRQAEISAGVPFARTIYHGLDPELYELGDGDGGYLAFLGRFAREKAPHIAIDAARATGSRLILGGAPHEIPESQSYFEREMKPRLAGARDIEWIGELAHRPKVDLLGRARALLFPLQWEEPFGLVMIEAMLVGTPVIAFARGSTPEVIEDGVTGFLVHDEREMAACIQRLDSIDRERCRARAVERWSTRRMAMDHVELYEQLVRKHGRGGHVGRVVPLTPARRSAHTNDSISASSPTLFAARGTDHGAAGG